MRQQLNLCKKLLIGETQNDVFLRSPINATVSKETIEKILKRINVNNFDSMKELGQGAKGKAYQISNDKVLKITKDASEARTSQAVMQATDTGILTKYFDVFKFKDTDGDDLFCIVQEKLEHLDFSFKKFIELLMFFSDTTGNRTVSWIYYFNLLEWLKDPANLIGQHVPTKSDLEWLENLVVTLKSLNITFKDLHSGNVLQRKDGSKVLIDLGFSQIPNAQDVPVLAKNIKAAIGFDISSFLLDGDTKALDEVIEHFKINPKNKTLLGDGGSGAAYKVSGDKVLKITDDKTEAHAAARIKQTPIKEAYTVYSVVQHPRHKEIYFILQELLDSPDHSYKELIEAFMRYQVEQQAFGLEPENVENFLSMYKSFKTTKEGKFLREAAKSISGLGIAMNDVHTGNIMKKKTGQHCFIDFGGQSKAPKQQIPTIKE